MKIKVLKNFTALKENLKLKAGETYEFSKERILDFEKNLPDYFEVVKEPQVKKEKKTPRSQKKGDKKMVATIISAITAVAVVCLPIFMRGEMKTCSRRQIEEIKTDIDIMRGELLRTRIIFLKDKKSEEDYRLILKIYDEILELRKKHDDKTIGNGYLDEVVERVKREWQGK